MLVHSKRMLGRCANGISVPVAAVQTFGFGVDLLVVLLNGVMDWLNWALKLASVLAKHV